MGFSPEWLALREPADRAARDPDLLVRAASVARTAGGYAPVIVDLGCGTGSTVRALRDHLPGSTAWQLVDNDPDLLREAGRVAGHSATLHAIDLCNLDLLPLDGAHLVTASALLDLTSAAWVERLAAKLSGVSVAFYAALSYDGRMEWTPPLPDDVAVTDAFNLHQQGDKGLGAALGPHAAQATRRMLLDLGYQVAIASSDWRLTSEAAGLQAELLDGIAAAAGETGLPEAAEWRDARRARLGIGECRIGHLDLLAWPARQGSAH